MKKLLLISFALAVMGWPVFAVRAAEESASSASAEPQSSASSVEMIREMPPDMPPGVFTLGVLGNDEEVESFGNVLVPVYYDGESTLLFVTPRFTAGDNDEEELNVGIGVRYLFPGANVIVGANAFYDYRWTENDSEWSQYGFGMELLTEWVDARANYYLPENDKELVDEYETVETSTSSSTDVDYGGIYAQGNGLYQEIVTTRRTTKTTVTKTFRQWEAALEGYDAEIGVKLPYISDFAETRVFVGYQSFDNPFGDDMEGAKGRLEIRALPGLFLDAEWYDNEELNGTDYAVGARLNLSLNLAAASRGENPFAGIRKNFSSSRDQQFVERMTEMVIRDLKVRTVRSEYEEVAEMRETKMETSTSEKRDKLTIMDGLTFVHGDNAGDAGEDGTAEHPYDTIQKGVNASTSLQHRVYVYDASFQYNENVVMPDGVYIYGAGTGIKGAGGVVFGGGSFPVVKGNGHAPTFTMGNNTTVSGFNIQNYGASQIPIPTGDFPQDETPPEQPDMGVGIYISNKTDVLITGNAIMNTSTGIYMETGNRESRIIVHGNGIIYNQTMGVMVFGGPAAGHETKVEISGNDIISCVAGIGHIAGSDSLVSLTINDNRMINCMIGVFATTSGGYIGSFTIYNNNFYDSPEYPGYTPPHSVFIYNIEDIPEYGSGPSYGATIGGMSFVDPVLIGTAP